MKHFLPKSRHFAWAFFWLLTTTIGWGQTLINESFESTTFPPTNWSNSSSGWVRSTNSARTGSASAASNGVNDALTTPLLVNPNQLSFWYRRSTNTAAWELIVDVSSSLSGPWTTVKTISSVTTTYQEETTDLSSFQNIYVRFRDNRSSGTAERYIDDVVVTELLPPILTINNNGTQVTTGNVNQGAVNHLLSTFQVGVATANATLNQVSFAASGNFTAGDVTSFKLFTNNTNTFPGGTPLATVDATSIANGGTVTFGSLSQTCAIGDRYFWVAADVSATATPNNTIGVPSLSTSNFTFASGSVSGTIDAGGTQTIVEVTPQITLSSPSASVANLTQGINNQAFYRFDLAVTTANTTLNGVTITTAGTYSASDLTNIKCWYSADTSFDAGSDVLLSTKTTSLEAGIQVFPSFTNQLITSGTTGYIFITVDVPLNAVAGNTISVDAITTTDLSFITGNVTGTANASGTKTITNCTPTNATGLALTPGNGQIIVNWTNPVCFDEVLIVAKATTSITANPTGDGTLYNANLTFGTGDAFDSGFVVYKGTTSPQTITGLTNGTTYFVKIFTRRGTDWSSGVESSAVPQLQNATAIIYLSSSSTTWLTAANWTGGSIPNGTQVAQFSENPTSGLLGINFNGTTNAGVQVNGQKIQEAGAIEVNSSRTSNMSIGNSSTTAGATGQLRLNGVIVNATENVVIRNNSSQSVTIQNIQGSGNQTMVVLLNNFVNNLFDVDGSGDIIITSSITSASGPVTISGSGSGIVEFGGQNTYTTATNVNSSTLRLNRSGGTTIPTSNEVIVNGGTLRISTNQTLSNLTLTSGGLTVDAGATLTLNQNITIPDDFTITNNGTIVIQGTLTDNRTTKSFDGTVSFNGSSQQTIAAATTFSNLTINNTAGVKASGDITVNGVLNLASANPNATDGALDMVIAYGTYGTVSKLDPNNFNSTLEHNNLNSYVLNLGATATVTGVGDVTGKVSRTQTFVNNTTYAFSNANMTLNFNDGGSASNLPTKITVISTRGTKGLHADKDVADNGNPAIGGAAVLRLWQILRTDGAAAARFTVRFPYEEAELNGNTEGNLVTWDHHLDNPAYEGITPHEHGKTNNDATNNFVELANHSLFYLTTEGSTTNTKYWMLSDQITTNNTWLGAADIPAGQSNWNSTSNWTSGVAPTANDHVVIEPVGVAARNPEFVSGSYSFGSMEIKSGAEVDAGAATITLNNGPASNGNVAGSWLNNGTFNAGTSTVIFNAGVDNLATLAGNTNFHHITVNTGKTLRLEQNAVMGVAGTLTVNGALDATQSENTVVFNGTTDQTVPATTTDNTSAAYHTLELAGAGVKSFSYA